MMTATTMKKIKQLVGPIPSSPYGWKNTSEKRRNEIISMLMENREYILNLELSSIIEGELYDIENSNSSQTFDALRSIKKVMMEKYRELKE